MQGYAAFVHNQTAGDFGTAETPRTTDTYAFGSRLHSAENGLFHGTPVSDVALYLVGDIPADQESVEFRLLDFLDIQLDLLTDHVLQ
jgi:hypothetical protein